MPPARRADERDELAALDLEVDVLQGDDVAVAGGKGEAEIFGGNDAQTQTPVAGMPVRCTWRGAVISFHCDSARLTGFLASRGTNWP